MTGFELYKEFQRVVDAPYTGMVDPAKFNKLIAEAIDDVTQSIYNNRLVNQNAFDEMSFLLSLNTEISVTNNQFFHTPIPIVSVTSALTTAIFQTELPHNLTAGDSITVTGVTGLNNINGTVVAVQSVTSPVNFIAIYPSNITGTYIARTGVVTASNMLSDYAHYLYGEATFLESLSLTATKGYNTSPARIAVNKKNRLRDGDKVRISGFTTGNINGDFFVKYLNEFLLALYTDKSLSTPVVGASITGTGTVEQLITSPLKYKFSDQKASAYKPTTENPYYQLGKLVFTVYPEDVPCETVKIDYVRKIPFAIDAANTSDDLDKYYPDYFQHQVVDMAAKNYGFLMRDTLLSQESQSKIIENP